MAILDESIDTKETKIHGIYARDLYDVPYVGAKHPHTQAIGKVEDGANLDATIAVLCEKDPSISGTFGFRNSASIETICDAFVTDLKKTGIYFNLQLVQRYAASLMAKPFLILAGQSGSGKTKIAKAFAEWMCGQGKGGVSGLHLGQDIPSKNTVYKIVASGSGLYELETTGDTDSKNVVLSQNMVDEWKEAIRSNGFTKENTKARTIRESLVDNSKYASQMNSFETHLKALAFEDLSNNVGTGGYCVVPVGAGWDSDESLLGHIDYLRPHDNSYVKPENGALDLILEAEKNPTQPYFLILDEMNLSHVERYFSKFLSSIESGLPIRLHSGVEATKEGVPPMVSLGRNLFIVGTVNVDETTYMFSPKVLDRANVIEFRPSFNDIKSALDIKGGTAGLSGLGTGFGPFFMGNCVRPGASVIKRGIDSNGNVVVGDGEENFENAIKLVLEKLFSKLSDAGGGFGHRTISEMVGFSQAYSVVAPSGVSAAEIMDIMVIQKLLPKLSGSAEKLRDVLATIEDACTDKGVGEALKYGQGDAPILPLTYEKIKRMQKSLKQGFASFSEA